SESADPLNDINALAEVCEPGTIVIAAGTVNDVRLYRDLVASGIHDYLLKPFTVDQLRDTFAHAQMILSGPRGETQADRPHVMAAVIGVRCGVGASTIATSHAWLFGEKSRRTTALLDLDVHFGTGALALPLGRGRVAPVPGSGPRLYRRDRKPEPHRRPVHRARHGSCQRASVS